MFFNELVERDRGLRMILMVWLVFPHPQHMYTSHTHIHTHTLWATWSPLLWSDHSPQWSEVIQWELSSLSPVGRSGLLSCLRLNLGLVKSKPPCNRIPHCCSSYSSNCLTVGPSLSRSLSRCLSLALIFLARSACDVSLA